jgi:hypothetical protein
MLRGAMRRRHAPDSWAARMVLPLAGRVKPLEFDETQ